MTFTKTRSAVSIFALAAACAVGLSACIGVPQATHGPSQLMHPVQVAESIERLELYTRPDGLELSARDKLAVAQFLDGYRNRGDGPLYMNKPSAAMSGLGTSQADQVIRGLMAQNGLNPSALQSGSYQSAPGAPAPVVVSYRALRAIPQDCRGMSNIANTYNNQPQSNYGCFMSANLAAMITDPRQLLEPYAQGTPNSQRRTVVYDKYIQGDTTAATVNGRQEISASE